MAEKGKKSVPKGKSHTRREDDVEAHSHTRRGTEKSHTRRGKK